MSAAWTWVRLDLRGRARSLVVLALLVALTTTIVLSAVAGARRGSTAVDRMLDRGRPATVAVLPNETGFDWEAVAALPEVEAIARFPLSEYAAEGLPDGVGDFAWVDDEIMRDIEQPVVLEGRIADPSRDDEVVVTANFESSTGKGVGDTVTIRLLTPEQVDGYYLRNEEADPAGPTISATIVGVVRSMWFSDSGDSSPGRLIPSPGLFAAHRASFMGTQDLAHVNALVRLRGGASAIPAFREHLADASGRRDIDFFDLPAEVQHIDEVAEFEANALLAFALAGFIAAVFLVGQSVARFVTAAAQDLQVLLAVGMSPRDVRVAAAAGPTIAALAGAFLGVGGAIVASRWFPTGTAAPFEPSPGRAADLVVLLPGLLAVPGLIAAGALLASRSVARTLVDDGGGRPSLVANLTARTGAQVPLSVGASFALDRGRGSTAVPVYPAVLGAVVGVLGVVGALTFSAGISDASAHPERFGQEADLQAFLGFNGEDFGPSDELLRLYASDPDVLAVNDTRQGVVESGTVDIPAFALDPVDDPMSIVLTDGRRPTGPREVALAPQSADALGVGPGDTVELVGSRSTGSFTVSGVAFVPEGSHNEYDSGAWLERAAYDELIEGFKFHVADIELRGGADVEVVRARLGVAAAEAIGVPPDLVDAVAPGLLSPLEPPGRLAELREIRRLPLYLAAFLSLLAVAAVGHAVATAVRRRRHDLATLRALGVTRWQSRATVLVQATLLALVGLTLGVPLGFALGRTLWRSVADSTPVDYIPPFAVWTLVLVAPVSLLAANLLAAWPSHRAASMRVAQVLRTE